MEKRRIYQVLIPVLLIVIGTTFWLRTKNARPNDELDPPAPTLSAPLTPSSSAIGPSATSIANKQDSSMAGAAAPIINMQTLSRALFDYSRPGRDVKDLIQYLQSSGQEPHVARDKNEITGELLFVRTKSPLPGTRYFHAQYFSDGDDAHFLQHMSFEIPAGPRAMPDALAAVQSAFPGLGQPSVETENLISWDAGGGYTVWVKRLSEQELLDNPFNAYTKDDAGTIRIAIEATPESD